MKTQHEISPTTDIVGRCLEFDFPSMRIGVAEYSEGPTGATVFWFPDRAVATVDVRGGAPGSFNLDWLRLGYDFPNLDAMAGSGGSWYGRGTAAGVAAALQAEEHRSGHWANLANVAGAIIYDYGTRRVTNYHPDERLGAAALGAARAGRFPLGAQGAGRNTMHGSYFGLWLHSGQGGAFRQIGPTKIAAFAVVNSVGVAVDRDGRLAVGDQSIPTGETSIGELLAQVPEGIRTVSGTIMGARSVPKNPSNTTISVVVTNQKLTYAELQRLAVQVHMSMGRAIQPFATANDGDILFAVSTAEVENPGLHPTDLGVVASDVMWSAILSSVPEIHVPGDPGPALALEEMAGPYSFAPGVDVEVRVVSESLELTPRGTRDLFDIGPGGTVRAGGRRMNTLSVEHPFLEQIRFERGAGGRPTLLLNPGPWQQVGIRKG